MGRATGAALAVEFAFRGLQAIDETIQKFDALQQQVRGFGIDSESAIDSVVSKTEGLAKTFDQEAGDIATAANSLSKNLGVSFDEALGVIEDGFLAGADANGDFISSLTDLSVEAKDAGVSAEELALAIQQSASNGETANAKIIASYKNIGVSLNDVIDDSSDFTKQQREQLAANEALAEAQNELANNLSGASSGIKTLGTNIATIAITAFNDLVESLSPVAEAFSGLFESLGGLFSAFGATSEEGSRFGGVIGLLSVPLKVASRIITFLVNTFSTLVDGVSDFVSDSPFLQSAVTAASDAFGLLGDTISAIPAFFSGIVAAGSQAGTNIANFFRGIAIDAQLLFQKIQAINPFGPTQEQIDETVADLRRQRAELDAESIGIFDAFGNAFNAALESQADLAEQIPDTVEGVADEVEEKLGNAFKNGFKDGTDAAKDSTKELEKEAIEGSLRALREAVSAIKKELEEVADGTDNFKAKLEELITAEEKLAVVEEKIKLARESETERNTRIAKEKAAIEKKNKDELKAARDLVNEVTDEALAQKIIELTKIKKLALDGAKLTAKEREKIEEDFNKAVLKAKIQAEKERITIAKAGSKEELAAKQAQLDAEIELLEIGAEKEEELAKKRMERIKKQGEEEEELRKAIINAVFEAAKLAANTTFDIAIQKAEDKKNDELELVREEFAGKLEQAQGNAAATEALKKEQLQREGEIEKKAAETQKALSITKAIIAGALGAVQTIANLGFPAAIPGLIAVVAATAANIATITSQKLAKGGLAKKKMEDGGIAPGSLHSDGGTPAIIGGQEMVEIELGEGIVNRRSTKKYLQTISDINQAEGGIRFEGTLPLNKKRLQKLNAFSMISSQMPSIARRGLSPRIPRSTMRMFQTGGLASAETVASSFGQDVELQGRILADKDVELIARATAKGVQVGIEQANLFGQFKRQAEREIGQDSRSQV